MPALLLSEISSKVEVINCLIISLGKMIAHCIETGDGLLKSLIVPVLAELENYQIKEGIITGNRIY